VRQRNTGLSRVIPEIAPAIIRIGEPRRVVSVPAADQ